MCDSSAGAGAGEFRLHGRGNRAMTLDADRVDRPVEDPVSNVLKWVLLATAILTFALLAWATAATYRLAPPQPERFVGADGTVLMTSGDVVAGKGGFQKADLMDYGSIYGMGSYFGEDYTASTLVRLGTVTRENLANALYARPFARLDLGQSAAVTATMQNQLQTIDLTRPRLVIPAAASAAIRTVQAEIVQSLNKDNLSAGWIPARSLDPQLRVQTADFIVYCALTTVARRPNMKSSWTENWPFEPLVGNTPTTNTFQWTWISFCFTFFSMGLVLFLYRAYLDHPDDAAMERGLAVFLPLTPSQRKTGN